ncbi:MAG: hypothetical protein LBF27_08890 [Sphingobacterium sp.]|nr:hypothetical protein [Sphingobacterium sp.]
MKFTNYIILHAILISFFSAACKKDGSNSSGKLEVTEFLPLSGGANAEIIINGSGFSEGMTVSLNGIPLKIINFNQTAILARIPQRAGSGKIEISNQETTAVSKELFTYNYQTTVSTLAGSQEEGFFNGPGLNATFILTAARAGLDVDANLNVYVTDPGNHCIRKISPAGVVTTLAGNPGVKGYIDGKGGNALFEDPYDVACDDAGNVFVADRRNLRIRKITVDGTVSTYVKTDTVAGIGSTAPYGIGINKKNGFVYYTEWNANGGSICEINANGQAKLIAQVNKPGDIACDGNNDIYVTSNSDHIIKKIDFKTRAVSTYAGTGQPGLHDGALATAAFETPWGLACTAEGNILVAGYGYGQNQPSSNQCIRFIDTKTLQVGTYAGSRDGSVGDQNGDLAIARFNGPTGVAVDKNGTVYVYDKNNNRIRKIVKE